MPFSTVAIPFDAYAALPNSQSRWLMTCLARYCDRDGKCWPSMRQLAADARMSKSSVQRLLADLSQLGVFTRSRRPGGRYGYVLNEMFRPCWPRKASQSARFAGVPGAGRRVPQYGTERVNTAKHKNFSQDFPEAPWAQRMTGWLKSRFWLPQWGNRPDEPGCLVPPGLLPQPVDPQPIPAVKSAMPKKHRLDPTPDTIGDAMIELAVIGQILANTGVPLGYETLVDAMAEAADTSLPIPLPIPIPPDGKKT
jgi:hypothetical protein